MGKGLGMDQEGAMRGLVSAHLRRAEASSTQAGIFCVRKVFQTNLFVTMGKKKKGGWWDVGRGAGGIWSKNDTSHGKIMVPTLKSRHRTAMPRLSTALAWVTTMGLHIS